MDFRQTFQSANRNEAGAAPVATNSGQVSKKDNSGGRKNPLWLSILIMAVLIGAALLVIAAAVALVGKKSGNEDKYVNTKAYQAVFLSNGQVYFGKVNALNSQYINMSDVFYLTQSSSTSSTSSASNADYTLVKLGCQQIHYPKDQMLINRDQVTFWENLSDGGKVVKSINEFKKQNPNGENCSTTTTGTQSTNSGTSATQNSSNTSTNSTTTNNSSTTGN